MRAAIDSTQSLEGPPTRAPRSTERYSRSRRACFCCRHLVLDVSLDHCLADRGCRRRDDTHHSHPDHVFIANAGISIACWLLVVLPSRGCFQTCGDVVHLCVGRCRRVYRADPHGECPTSVEAVYPLAWTLPNSNTWSRPADKRPSRIRSEFTRSIAALSKMRIRLVASVRT